MSDANPDDDGSLSWRRCGRLARLEAMAKGTAPKAGPFSSAIALSVGERLRIARTAGTPQAVLRVLAFRHGRAEVRDTLVYVAAKSGWHFVTDGDRESQGRHAIGQMLDAWSRDFSTRKNGRDAVHIEVSAPEGYDRDRVFAAARAFAAAEFGPNHRYALVEHRDTRHPHCHIIVKLRGRDGQRLGDKLSDIRRWRSGFAAAARAEGLPLEASPRAARGLGQRNARTAVAHIRKRGAVSLVDRKVEVEAIEDARAGHHEPTAIERRMLARNDEERRAYAAEAERVARAAERARDPAEKAALARAAADLARFAAAMPRPKSARQAIIAKVVQAREFQSRGPGQEFDVEAEF